MITKLSIFKPLSLLGAVVNDTTNTNNLNIIIFGMVIIIFILLGTFLFAPKR